MSSFKYSESDFDGFLNLVNQVRSVKFHNDNINIDVYNGIKKWIKELPVYKNKKTPKKYDLTEEELEEIGEDNLNSRFEKVVTIGDEKEKK